MASRPSRLERITNLFLALLETPRPLSLREIGVAVAGYPTEPTALRQAFERDKRTLRDEGVPVAVERIDGEEQVGYRILPEQYYLPDLGLSSEEQEALAFALAAVRLEGGVGRSALEKLSPEAVLDLAPMAVLPTLPALPVLQDAIRRRCVVRFVYHARTREVEGHELVFRLGAWYFAGRDRSANGELRTFRVDRFETPASLGEPAAYDRPALAERGEAVRLAPWAAGPAHEEDGVAPVTVTLEVDVRELAYARGMFGEHALAQRMADGSGRFVFPVADEAAFVAWVLGRGDAVEVIGPPALREQVIAQLAALSGEAQ